MKFAIVPLLCVLGGSAHATTMFAHLESRVDDNSVQAVLDVLTKADDSKEPVRVILEINTDGGDIDSGFMLAKAIERSKARVVCVVDGQAASMGSYILESCDRRIMTKRSLLMIHEAGASTGGHSWDLSDAANEMAALSRAMFEHYAHHIPGLTATQIAEKTTGGRCIWLDWKEAKKLGAVDAVVDTVMDVR